MNVLLVEPTFPIPPKSKNHKNFLPVGLLKIASYLRSCGTNVKLIRGCPEGNIMLLTEIVAFCPNEIWITSLFTYWSKYVRDAVGYYKDLFPSAKIVVGGIYASLMPEHCKEFTGCDAVHTGVLEGAEEVLPAYDLIQDANPEPVDYQIIHASRGCARKCSFCGVWKVEPQFKAKKSIKDKITSRKIVFYDNNLLYNPHIENILQELINLKRAGRLEWCDSQSGFDGRILMQKPYLARMVKDAGFRQPRIAWDWGYIESESIRTQIDLLTEAGYDSREIYIFMLYNWDIPFAEMEKKRVKCWEWRTQIADCRYRPLQQTYDDYRPHRSNQTIEEYYIHEQGGWTDTLVKQFRKNVRRQNICVRQQLPFYSRILEKKRAPKELMREVKSISGVSPKLAYLDSFGFDHWVPSGE